MVSFGDEAGKKKVWWTQPVRRSRCAALLIILYGLIAGPWVFAGEADRGPLQDYVDPPIIVPSQRGPEDIISIVMEYGGCFNFSNESSLEINGRSIVLVIGEVNLSTCIRSPRRAREFVIGRLDGGEYTLDVLIERGSPPGQVPPSPFYTGIRFSVFESDPIGLPTLSQWAVVALVLLVGMGAFSVERRSIKAS